MSLRREGKLRYIDVPLPTPRADYGSLIKNHGNACRIHGAHLDVHRLPVKYILPVTDQEKGFSLPPKISSAAFFFIRRILKSRRHLRRPFADI